MWAHQKDPREAGQYCSWWGVLRRGIDVAGGQGEHKTPYGAGIKSVWAGTPEQGWGNMGHPMLRVWGPEWDGDSNHADSSLSKPNLPDEDGDDKNSSQDQEGKDPEGHQDGHLLQGVTAVWDRETVMAEGCHSPQHPGSPIASSWTPQHSSHPRAWGKRSFPLLSATRVSRQAAPHSCPAPPALLTDGLRVGSLGGLLSQALQAGVCSGFFTCCGGWVWKDRGNGNHSPKIMRSTPVTHREEQRRVPLCPRGATSPRVPLGC